MFRKIVSNLPYSPALVGQLGFYAKRLRKEELTRRLGLIFTALALVVQSFAVFQPPEAANAASSADFVKGGVSSVSDFLKYYDRNSNNIKDVFNSLGITRAEIAKAKKTTIGESSRYNWSMTSLYSHAQGQRSWDYGKGKAYYRPMRLTQQGGNKHPVYYSHSKTQGWFAIKIDCGNLITEKPPSMYEEATLKPRPTPTPTPIPPITPPKPTPAAACAAVGVKVVNRTLVELTGSATASGGATVSKYTFVVKDATGKVVKEIPVTSTSLSVGAPSFSLNTPGTYSVSLTVTTSVGQKTNTTSCVKQFTIAKPEVCPYNPQLPPSSPDCQPCPDPAAPPNTPIDSPDCTAEIVQKKTAINLDEGNKLASSLVAQPSQRISYSVSVTNNGYVAAKAPIEERLEDVLEYSTLVDLGGGTFDATTKTLTWPEVELKPGATQTRTFVVQLMNQIPTTNTGVSNESSYDCRMTNTFGNEVEIDVNCPAEKVIVEQVVSELPTTGPTENMIFAAALLTIVTYFYARSRQMGKEIRLIRKDIHAGTI